MGFSTQAQALAQRAEEAGCEAATWHAAALAAGVNPEAIRGLMGAALALGAPLSFILASVPPWAQDTRMLSAAADTADTVKETGRAADRLSRQARQALAAATAAFAAARGARASASSAEESAAADAAASAALSVITDCSAALELLDDLLGRLSYALQRLESVPSDLTEVYEAAYRLVNHGRALPHEGRWVTGQIRRAPLTRSGA